MKLGLGLYRSMLTKEYYRFAKQAGCTHLVDYFPDMSKNGLPATDAKNNWGVTTGNLEDWSYESLRQLKAEINEEGLELYAIENFDPAHWYDVLLAGPRRDKQIGLVKSIIRNVGKAGIPVIGYNFSLNFSLAGVWGHTKGEYARGGAVSVGFTPGKIKEHAPLALGEVWNMTYDPNAPQGELPKVSEEELWERLAYFLKEIVPVAEAAGVRLAAHPDDPPMPTVRDTPRLVYTPQRFQKLLDLAPSFSNAIDFCMGTVQEMAEGDLYEAIERYTKQEKVCYVHFRNVKGKVPDYREVFVDEGDIDMIKALRLYRKNGFEGVFIPDHTPQMACAAPWHAGMAYALGYMKAALAVVAAE